MGRREEAVRMVESEVDKGEEAMLFNLEDITAESLPLYQCVASWTGLIAHIHRKRRASCKDACLSMSL